MKFQDVTARAIGDVAGGDWPVVVVCDPDADGWPDLILGRHGNELRPAPENLVASPYGCKLFKNNRDGTFTEVTGTYLPLIVPGSHLDYHSFVSGDVDGDGEEEIVVGRHFDTQPETPFQAVRVFKTGSTPFVDLAAPWAPFMHRGNTLTLLANYPGADPGTLAILMVSAEANLKDGAGKPTGVVSGQANMPMFTVWKRVNGAWQFAQPRNGDGGQLFTIASDAAVTPYAIRCLPRRASGFIARVAGLDTNWWLSVAIVPTDLALWGFVQGEGDSTLVGLAPLSPYGHDAELWDMNNDGNIDMVTQDVGAGPDIVGGTRIQLGAPPTPAGDPQFDVTTIGQFPPRAGWGAVVGTYGPDAEVRTMCVADFDNDGNPDVYAVYSRGALFQGNSRRGPDVLIKGDGAGGGADVFAGSGLDWYPPVDQQTDPIPDGGGAAALDIDMDGRIDIVASFASVEARGAPFKVFRNVTPDAGRHVGFLLPVKDDIGTIVTVEYGGKRQTHELTARSGWQRQSSRTVHFGLGQYTGDVAATFRWRDGTASKFTVPSGQYHRVTRTGTVPFSPPPPPPPRVSVAAPADGTVVSTTSTGLRVTKGQTVMVIQP